MATTQGQLNQILLEELLKIQIDAETKMLEKVAKRVKKGITTPGWNEQKLDDTMALRKEIESILKNKNKITNTYVQKALLKSYDNAGKSVSKAIFKKPESVLTGLIPLHLQHMILETQNAIAGTSFQILRETNDIYREVISETTTGVLTGVETRQQVAQQALNNFAAKGITGFVDKAGRKWELATYTEMAIRTANSRAALQGHVDRSLELNQDLMLVSGHAATCPICAPWGNKVISITGKTPGYPTLDTAKAAGLFHPNCKHTLTVWFPDLEGNQEHLEQYQQEPDIEKYNAIQRQRYNERKIREYKRLEAVAMDPESKQKARNKVLQWQGIQRKHVEDWNLRRKYNRESITNRTGDPTKASKKPDIPKDIIPKDEPKVIPKVESVVENNIKSLYSLDNDGSKKDYNYEDVKGMSKVKKVILLNNNNTGIPFAELKELKPSQLDAEIDKLFGKQQKPKEMSESDLMSKVYDINGKKIKAEKKETKIISKPAPKDAIFFYHGTYTKEELKDMSYNEKTKILLNSTKLDYPELKDKIFDEPEWANKELEKLFDKQREKLNDKYSQFSREFKQLTKEEVNKSIDVSREWFSSKGKSRIRSSFKSYTGDSYNWMNRWYRKDKADILPSDRQTKIDNMLKGFNEAPKAFDKDAVLYRATGFSYFDNAGVSEELKEKINNFTISYPKDIKDFDKVKEELEQELKNALVGVQVPEKSFTSTSYRKGAFGSHKPVQLTIAAPVEKSKAIQLCAISNYGDSEAEILFAPGMNNEIKNVYLEKGNSSFYVVRIEVETLGHVDN